MSRQSSRSSAFFTSAALVVILAPAGAHAQVFARSGPPAGAERVGANGPVQLPAAPYAGAWQGTLVAVDASGAAVATIPVALTLVATDLGRQVYGAVVAGQNGGADARTAMLTGALTGDGSMTPVLGRSANGSTSGETAATDAGVSMLWHPIQHVAMACDAGHRCLTLPALQWEDRNASGVVSTYSVHLSSPTALAGTVTVRDPKSGESQAYRIELSRKG